MKNKNDLKKWTLDMKQSTPNIRLSTLDPWTKS